MTFSLPNRPLARSAAGVGLALALAAGTTLLTGSAAHAQTVTSGSLAFSGDPGDWISGGQSYSYSTAGQDRLDVTANPEHTAISVSLSGAHGDWWYLDLAAPEGQTLQAGTYTGATRSPFNGPAEPGLSLSGDGRGCNTLTGSFTITDVVYGPNGYVQTLDAAFEQHCEGGSAAARGEVHLSNPAPPAELALGVGVAVDGTASTLNGNATVHGTVTCNKPVAVNVSNRVTQVSHRALIRGSYGTTVNCTPGAPVAWSATVAPEGAVPFQKGDVEVASTATALDPDYQVNVTATKTVAVHLTKG
ncbi:hypothetical protein [Kitasatospora terrestris]|uniref:Uncharacterized protein n=1 Tax=Kitasatospora terrestris TaxID=258051 RepID=A0ABP9E058_9ACTN